MCTRKPRTVCLDVLPFEGQIGGWFLGYEESALPVVKMTGGILMMSVVLHIFTTLCVNRGILLFQNINM